MLSNPALGPSLGGMSPETFFGNLIPAILSLLFVIGIVAFVFYLIMGGIQWITAGGDKGKLEVAKQHLTQAMIGITILLSFFAILNLTECFFGIGLRAVTIGAFNISLTGSMTCQ